MWKQENPALEPEIPYLPRFAGRLRKYRILPCVELFKKPGFSPSWFLQTTEKIDRSFSAVLIGGQRRTVSTAWIA